MVLTESLPQAPGRSIALPATGWRAVGLWGVFLGASWTWVIGMLLPVLLVRDIGWLGWVVFAVPNVVGAGAMGWVLRDAEASRRVVERHREAAVWFSDVTVGFQLLGIAWMGGLLWGTAGVWVGVIAVALPIALNRPVHRGYVWGAMGVLAVSLLLFGSAQPLPGAWGGLAGRATVDAGELAWFALPALAGFSLCPYLDLTFHRARQATSPGAGRGAFALGFGVLFLAMLLFSLCYANVLAGGIARDLETGTGVGDAMGLGWRAVLGVHLVVQAGYTVLLHSAEAFEHQERRKGSRIGGWLLVNLPVLFYLLIAGEWTPLDHTAVPTWMIGGGSAGGMTWGEWFYRVFMLAYGTVFPAYVWLCMIPSRGRGGAERAQRVFAVAAVVGFGLGYLGFIAGQPWAMGAAVVVVISARAAVGLPRLQRG